MIQDLHISKAFFPVNLSYHLFYHLSYESLNAANGSSSLQTGQIATKSGTKNF